VLCRTFRTALFNEVLTLRIVAMCIVSLHVHTYFARYKIWDSCRPHSSERKTHILSSCEPWGLHYIYTPMTQIRCVYKFYQTKPPYRLNTYYFSIYSVKKKWQKYLKLFLNLYITFVPQHYHMLVIQWNHDNFFENAPIFTLI